MNYLSLLMPFAYLGILLTSLATFSSLYRKRKARKANPPPLWLLKTQTLTPLEKSLSLSPYFPPHTPRNIYLSLLHLDDPQNPNSQKIPQSLLRAALLSRCTENIHRIIHVRTRKAALGSLLKKGQVGEEIWLRLMRAEAELEAEVKECVEEANAFAPNWGATIFQSANEMANNDVLKARLEVLGATTTAEKEAWEEKCAESRRELEGERVESKGLLSPAAGLAAGASGRSSDEDGVLVDKERGVCGAESGGGGGKKKKKNKK